MVIETLYGVNVVDAEGYAEYRARMTPLLEAQGGCFIVDVRVAEVLRSPAARPFNRLFTLRFTSLAQREAFFADPEYREVRRNFFERSVSDVVELGNYELASG